MPNGTELLDSQLNDGNLLSLSHHLMSDKFSQYLDTEPVIVKTANGTATFQRQAEDRRMLRVEYHIPELYVALDGKPVEAGVEVACNEEILRMRTEMAGLGDALAEQLSDDGINPIVSRRWQNADERDWDAGDSAIRILASKTVLDEQLNGATQASDARLAQETLRLMIEQREANIRTLYQQILSDVRAKQSDAQRPDSVPHSVSA